MVTLTQIVKEKESAIRTLPNRLLALTEKWQNEWSADGEAKLVNLLNRLGKGSQIGHASSDRITAISFKYRMVSVER